MSCLEKNMFQELDLFLLSGERMPHQQQVTYQIDCILENVVSVSMRCLEHACEVCPMWHRVPYINKVELIFLSLKQCLTCYQKFI